MIGVTGRTVVGRLGVGVAALGLAAVSAPGANGSLTSNGGSERFIVCSTQATPTR